MPHVFVVCQQRRQTRGGSGVVDTDLCIACLSFLMLNVLVRLVLWWQLRRMHANS